MSILKRKEDPVNQPVDTVGPHGERVVLTPFKPQHTEGDEVEGFGATAQGTADAPKGRLTLNIGGKLKVVIK